MQRNVVTNSIARAVANNFKQIKRLRPYYKVFIFTLSLSEIKYTFNL